ncbi:MAG TPA: hypothetical protein VG498_12870 [Terriglobales bacterium]|nr:hypothetical protein [Terriglobales bacterium]
MTLACALAAAQSGANQLTAKRKTAAESHNTSAGYVGSQECALCHPDIYEKYTKTDMGRAVVVADAALLAKIPSSDSIFEQRLNRYFDVYARDGKLYQTEYQLGADGHEVFRDTRKVEWIIGAGENGFGAIVREGDYLFEAPLSFYTNIKRWALSPGYQFADYGFSRPILSGCISCHSGRPQPVLDGNGRFHDPPFQELAVGCENCHGPGEAHIAAASTDTIVNPAKLSGWQADNICMGCHQTGDARVLHSGKDYGDFRPGDILDDTLSIFLVPFGPQSPPRDDLLEHYLSMRLSKCYRSSQDKMSCITCHNPHVQPTAPAEAPAHFRQKCLTCHAEQSCKLPLATRQSQMPPDDCIACHMPKRDVKVISHSVLTNHRIVRTPQEPFPDSAFRMTSAALPDLVHLSAPPSKRLLPPPLILLQAYRQVMLSHPEYRQRYWNIAKDLKQKETNSIAELQGLADLALQQKSLAGVNDAIHYLDRARMLGSTQPSDFEQLAKMLLGTQQQSKAVDVLHQGTKLIPYDAELYRLLVRAHSSLGQTAEACDVLTKANRLFPQDDNFRSLLGQCSRNAPSGSSKR